MPCLKVSVDATKCVASGTCVAIAPAIFDLPADAAVALVKLSEITDPDLIDLAREADESCPSAAIVLEEVE